MNLAWVQHVPWNLGKDDRDAEGEVEIHASPGERLSPDDIVKIIEKEASPHQLPHRPHRFKADFERHGCTDRCPGCSAMLRNMHTQPHSDACRARMDTCLQQAAKSEFAATLQQTQGPILTRDEVLDMEESAMASGDPMELEGLAQWYLEASDPKRRRIDADTGKLSGGSGGASSPRDVAQVAVDPEFQKFRETHECRR